MNFTSLPFLGFVTVSICAFWCAPNRYKWMILLIFSMYYGWSLSGLFMLHGLIVSCFVYFVTLFVDKQKELMRANKGAGDYKEIKQRGKRKTSLVLATGTIALLLSWLFLKFLPQIDLAHRASSFSGWIAPAGISFYTLSLLSYLIDVCNGNCKAEKNIGKVILFTIYYPCIVQGPINRYGNLRDQFEKPVFHYNEFVCGFEQVVWGYFKKMVLADRLFQFTKGAFQGQYAGSQLILASIMAEIQLYADFSGGIDIACGISKMMGINMPLNFDFPFLASSISEYWRRWHITLGNWMRDYIFYPLSLSKLMTKLGKTIRKHNKEAAAIIPGILSMAALWVFCALWHGNSLNFVLWGLYFWLLVSLDTIIEKKRDGLIQRQAKAIQVVIHIVQVAATFVLASIGEMISQSNGWQGATTNLKNLFAPSDAKVFLFTADKFDRKDWLVVAVALVVLVTFELLSAFFFNKKLKERLAEGSLPLRWMLLIVGILVTLIFGYYGAGYDPTPFVYFQF